MRMEWTKIPTTIISKRYSDYEILSIVKFQLVWAMNEEQPDKTTALRYMTARQYDTAMTYLDSISAQVNDEVSLVVKKRNAEKIRYNKNKDLSKILQADSEQTVSSLWEQIRLDKIREDKGVLNNTSNQDGGQLGNQDENTPHFIEKKDLLKRMDELIKKTPKGGLYE